MSELHDLSVVEQRDALRRRVISSVELTEHYLDRIERYGGQLGAFVERTPDLAREEATAADRRLADGDKAPLLGIPLAFKDLSPVAGVRAHLGSRLVDVVPQQDGHVVGRLRRSGVVTVGTTHAPELGPTCFTHTEIVGAPAVTPYDVSRYASGSSGGAAAAVAAGLLPFAHGSDGAGSIRTPAGVCGLVGVKPSRGRVSSAPSGSFLAWGTEGPITRTVEDAAVVLDVMTGSWAGDLYGLPATRPFVEGLLDRPQPLRVLMWTDSGLAPPDPEALQAVQTARDLLHQLGHVVVEADNPVPWTSALQDALLVLFTAAVAVAARQIAGDTRDLLAPYTRWSLEEAERHSAVDFAAAQAVVATAAARQLAAAADYDVVLTPTAAGPAAPVGWFEQDGTGEECGRRMLAWSAYTPWANLTGQPALSLPLHVTDSGLPVGAHLVGARVGDDHLLLRLAAQLEWAAPFAHRHPPQW